MGGHDLAIAGRQCTELGPGFGEQGIDFLQVRLAVAFVVGLVGRVGSFQCLGDVADIQLGIRQVVPCVRVGDGLAILIQ
ncbi:hypothetical protein D3C84_1263790 [compost metagenome]